MGDRCCITIVGQCQIFWIIIFKTMSISRDTWLKQISLLVVKKNGFRNDTQHQEQISYFLLLIYAEFCSEFGHRVPFVRRAEHIFVYFVRKNILAYNTTIT